MTFDATGRLALTVLMKLCIIQMSVGADKPANLQKAKLLVDEAVAKEKPHWLALPEMFDFAGDSSGKRANAEILGQGAAYECAQQLSRKHSVYFHAGSLHEWRPDIGRISNTSVAFNPKGEQIALYRKLHLFDITTPSGVDYRESAQIAAGDEVVTYKADELTFGCAICYDLRFPDLFQALRLKGADVIALPSAFTRETGRAHWEPLLRARAIETQCTIAAPAQTGFFTQEGIARFTYGHSMIVDPWGHVTARLGDGEGYIAVEIDAELLKRVRENMPVTRHRRFKTPELI
jgi:predicted amidohydrolase